MCPHSAHVWLVCRGFTTITVRPASSALACTIAMNCPQPASLMLRFRPRLAATLVPGCSLVPLADRVMLADRELLDAEDIVLDDLTSGHLVVEVSAPVGDGAVPGGHHRSGSLPIVRSSLFSLQDPLGPGQTIRTHLAIAGVPHVHAARGRYEAGETDINPDHRSSWRQRRNGHGVTRQDDKPPAALSFDRDRLEPTARQPPVLWAPDDMKAKCAHSTGRTAEPSSVHDTVTLRIGCDTSRDSRGCAPGPDSPDR